MPEHNKRASAKCYLLRFWPHVVLFILVITLFFCNYTPGTWLTGWDNLHPEFNFKVNIIDRSIFSTWQEYQGLGIRAGNAHAADLLRQIFLSILSFGLPPALLRYTYHFLALYLGAIGVYELITRKLLRSHSGNARLAGFLGSAFAVLNLGTMQNFYVPYEAFSHAFASYPWLFLSLFSLLEKPSKRTFLIFSIVNVLASPMFYIPTLFIVYCIMVGITLVVHIFQTKRVRLSMLIVGIIVAINAYWLLPFGAFVAHGTVFVSQVKINRLFTEEAFLRNQKFGTIADVPILRGFLFDTTDMVDTKTGANDFMMKPWISHMAHPVVYWSFLGIFFIITAGFISAIIRKKPHAGTLTLLWIISVVALLNDNPPTGFIFRQLQNVFPLFMQVFRFPYTKFVVPAILTYSCGFAYAWYALFGINKKTTLRVLSISCTCIIFTGLVVLNWPSFQGNFIYRFVRQEVPPEYQDLYTFFRTQPIEGKIANLPQPTFWGWTAYDWGYRGSGFPWYGIGQPILDRAFDVWNLENERYYGDLTQAIYTQETPAALEAVFDRYHISYAWIDERVILPYKPGLLFYPQLKTILNASKRFTKIFSSGKQTVYRFDADKTAQPITLGLASLGVYHPFPLYVNSPYKVTASETQITLTTTVSTGTLTLPPSVSDTWPILGRINQTNNSLSLVPILPKIYNNDVQLPYDAKNLTTVTNISSIDYIQINDHLINPNSSAPFLLYPKGNIIAAYSKNPTLHVNVSTSLFGQALHNCSNAQPNSKTLFGRDIINPNSLILFGSQSHPCIYEKLSVLVNNNDAVKTRTGILEISVDYKSEHDEHPGVCLTRSGETGCFFETFGAKTSNRTDDGWETLNTVIPIRDYPLGDIWLRLELAADSSTRQQIAYRNLIVNLYTNPTNIQRFDLNNTVQHTTTLPVSAGSLSLVFVKNEFGASVILPSDIPTTKQNCFTLGQGAFDKTVREDSVKGSYVRYSATDASSCDYFPIENRSIKAGAVAVFTTRNISGRPLKTCINIDPPGYCLTEDFVQTHDHNWEDVPLLVPPVGPTIDSTYYVQLDDYAVGQEIRTNDLASITFMPIPYPWIRALAVTSDNIPYADTIQTESDGTTIGYANPTMYVITQKKTANNANILTLSQSYDSGWIAWSGGKVLPHVLVNNWENGWVINPGTSGTIYIFFWPQLLEFLGFVLLPLPFLFICTRRRG